MRVLSYSVCVLPKLDNQEEVRRLRERYDPWFYQVQPYIVVVPSFTPATLDELEAVSAFLSQARRKQPPVALKFFRCVERGDRLICPVESGREELAALHRAMSGATPDRLLTGEEAFDPGMVVCRVPDPDRRIEALQEANRIGRTVGLVDAVSLVGIEPSGQLRLIAGYPFGIGRVDYFDLSAGA
ncbi:MAG TPA: hypothetical protein ENN51_04615 [candidate division WOR-3 bacterium]|uniref:2'-5' RNA ligase family protein n=1 Tax=candidate division WOR-3 bacterium TaxID=2052148 RepID=A0A7V0T5I4_UNCW3|nr:hypothetical protein [candidate division WOR-3 bacterium]